MKTINSQLPNDFNPNYAFQTMYTDLLVKFANGKYDIDFYLRKELANRGLDVNGKWIGFDEAKKEHKV